LLFAFGDDDDGIIVEEDVAAAAIDVMLFPLEV